MSSSIGKNLNALLALFVKQKATPTTTAATTAADLGCYFIMSSSISDILKALAKILIPRSSSDDNQLGITYIDFTPCSEDPEGCGLLN